MYIYQKKTILSYLKPNQILYSLENSAQFTGKIENLKFTVRERILMTSNVLFPVITGVVTECDDNSIVDVTFELSKIDKIGYGTCLFTIFILSLLLGFVSLDIILSLTLICFGIVVAIVLWALYVHNCRRAYKKICRLLKRHGDGSMSSKIY